MEKNYSLFPFLLFQYVTVLLNINQPKNICLFQMNLLLGVERVLLADVSKTSDELKSIDDKTMKGDHQLYFIEDENKISIFVF